MICITINILYCNIYINILYIYNLLLALKLHIPLKLPKIKKNKSKNVYILRAFFHNVVGKTFYIMKREDNFTIERQRIYLFLKLINNVF
jgi:hypothetical protein